jgi:hypothetical protein
MKVLFGVGLIVLLLGILSFFPPFPHNENHGVNVGGANLSIKTHDSQPIAPGASAALVAVGAVLLVAGARASKVR